MDISSFKDLAAISIGTLTLSTVIPALLVLVLCVILSRFVMKLFDRALAKSSIERSLHTFMRSAAKAALWLVTALIIADMLSIPVNSLIALLSVTGLAVSLAVQGTLSNLAGGIMILVSKPFVVDDYIEAGTISGTVGEIGLIYTRILTPDNKTVFAPNSEISAAKIVNYTAEKRRRIDLTICASYDSPVASVKGAISRCCLRHSEIETEPAPFINISDYKDSCIEYTLRAWVPTGCYWDVRFALLEDIKEEFDKAGVEMSYPHINVHMIDGK